MGKFWQKFFFLGGGGGGLGVFKTNVSCNAFWKFLWFRNLVWDFGGVKFWSRDFLGVLFEALGNFFGF